MYSIQRLPNPDKKNLPNFYLVKLYDASYIGIGEVPRRPYQLINLSIYCRLVKGTNRLYPDVYFDHVNAQDEIYCR